MKVLFIHQNFPGQFLHLAPALAQLPGNQIVALTMREQVPAQWQNIQVVTYRAPRKATPGIHRWLADLESKTVLGEACFHAALELKRQGFEPDCVVAHPGWGESLFIKDVWPGTKLGIYSEFYYRHEGADSGFDPEFPSKDPGEACRLHMKNANNLLHWQRADAGLAPTAWQASTFPAPYAERIAVIHDGIDTERVAPSANAVVKLTSTIGADRLLTGQDEVITFVNRNLEPYRGYHIFLRALPRLLRERPHARILIVGGDKVSYGAAPPPGTTWKETFIREVRPALSDADWSRVHFVGRVAYEDYLRLLQVSTVHVYLTYPFVLSWSLLEAMSAGCAVVASNTAPVSEVIQDHVNGRLFDFFDSEALASTVIALLNNPALRRSLAANARTTIQQHYDLRSVCLPRQIEWVTQLAGTGTSGNPHTA